MNSGFFRSFVRQIKTKAHMIYWKRRSLLDKTLLQFILYTATILLLATPVFYILTKNFYAEDMLDIIEQVRQGKPLPKLDLEEDIMKGVMLQFGLISAVLGVAFVVVLRFVSGKLWRPFDDTLRKVEAFRLEKGEVPAFPVTTTKEFERLNIAVGRLMENNVRSYKSQKEFTENASHELQTPLAILQGKLELLLQQPDLTEGQAVVIQDMFATLKRMTQLNRSLLLLARIDNRQYRQEERVDLVSEVTDMVPSLRLLAGGITIETDFQVKALSLTCNRILLESMINNLVVNAVRHNRPGGFVRVSLGGNHLAVANSSDEPPLNPALIFRRFYRPTPKTKGNGLGLAIVKAICDYHGWRIMYRHNKDIHRFEVQFKV